MRGRLTVQPVPRPVLRRAGRIILWTLIAVLLLRGLGGVLGQDGGRAAVRTIVERKPAAWPDARTRAFAVQFTGALLETRPRDTDAQVTARLRRFMPDSLIERVRPRLAATGPAARPGLLAVAGARRLDDTHALIVVAGGRWQLSVPVRRVGDRLAVAGPPAFVPAPRAPEDLADDSELEPVAGRDAQPVRDLLTRFLRAYLAGDAAAAAYYADPAASLGALTDPLRLVAVDAIARDKDGWLVTDVRARTGRCGQRRPEGCGVTYRLRYTIKTGRRNGRLWVTGMKER